MVEHDLGEKAVTALRNGGDQVRRNEEGAGGDGLLIATVVLMCAWAICWQIARSTDVLIDELSSRLKPY